MALRHLTRLVPASTVMLALCLGAVAALDAQDTRSPLQFASGRVSIAGNSNIHEYTASTTAVRVTRLQVAQGITVANALDEIVKPGALEGFEVAIAAATLSSPKEGLDKNMHKALKVAEHPEIVFRLLRLEARGPEAGALRAAGMLKVAGVEREVALDLTVVRTGATLTVHGALPLQMPDYGIKPPTAMLGMLKTDPKVTVSFETVLAIPLT
jgi:hypothetical protein